LAEGTFLTFDNQIDATTGTVKAKARFPNPDGRLFPNQFVNVSLLVDTLKNAPTIPVTAVRHGTQGDFVFLSAGRQDREAGRS
jgi:multidrug efflux system membrane fusion protein